MWNIGVVHVCISKYNSITIWHALRFQRDQINSLQNGRDSDLNQIENAFKDPEDGFW